MTNGEKYKTAKERTEAFYKYCETEHHTVSAASAFHWLDLEAPVEEPLPCPFCGSETKCAEEWNGMFRVKCIHPECWYSANLRKTRDAAIAAHNRVARAAKEKEANS